MKGILLVLGFLLMTTPVYALYDTAKVVQIDPTKKDGTTEITVEFTGAGEIPLKRTLLAGPRFTKDMVSLWAEDQVIDLNESKTLKSSLSVNEILSLSKVTK